jgi:hypothetical protein
MNKEEIKLIVLTTMAEAYSSDKSEIVNKLETARYEMSLRRACRREALLGLLLYVAFGIFLGVAVLSLNVIASSIHCEPRIASSSSPRTQWWELWKKPEPSTPERHSP